MTSGRIVMRVTLVLGALLSIGTIIVALWLLGPKSEGTWATVAGSLAVLSSIISAWLAARVFELQEDALVLLC